MEAPNLWQLLIDLTGELAATPLGAYWPWPLVTLVAALGLTHALWLLVGARAKAWSARRTTARFMPLAVLPVRLLPAALALVLALVGHKLLLAAGEYATPLLALALLAAMLLPCRLAAFALVRLLAPVTVMTLVERILGWAIWLLLLLLLLRSLGSALGAFDALAIPLGKSSVSMLDVLWAIVLLLLLVAGASYLGALIDRRVLAMKQLPIGLRVGIGKVASVLLMLFAIMLALGAVGLDLTTLTVIGGAVGVGLGFGLQRIASNFVSGFVLLGDRSIRPGDVITIGTRFGVVRELRARYVVVRDRDGVDTLIPNENIITSEVVNWSYADRPVRLKLPLQISYRDNPREAMALMERAAVTHPRVDTDPPPAARVMGFAESGIELELRFWIRDPEDGVNNVRSDLFLQIWDDFKAAAITIPYPQRDVHLHGSGSDHSLERA
jgi:small-conductance mechanosensitive channel